MANNERLDAIDGLRGVAAIAVVFYHYVGFIPLMGLTTGSFGAAVVWVTRYGYLGVPVFFVLSGYVIALTTSRYMFTPATGGRFLLRRLVRIAPPYLVMIAILTGTVIAGKSVGVFRNTTITPGQVAAHLIYAQDLLGFSPLDAAYWTLCLEIQFYIVFVAVASVGRRLSTELFSILLAVLAVGSYAFDVSDIVPQSWIPRLWFQFGIGILTYRADQQRLARQMLIFILPCMVALGVYREQASDVVVAVVAILLLCVGRIPRIPVVFLALGWISYSLYLVHGFVGTGLAFAFRSAVIQSEADAWVAIAACTVAAIVVAIAFYQICERRCARWSRLCPVSPPPACASNSAASANQPAPPTAAALQPAEP